MIHILLNIDMVSVNRVKIYNKKDWIIKQDSVRRDTASRYTKALYHLLTGALTLCRLLIVDCRPARQLIGTLGSVIFDW